MAYKVRSEPRPHDPKEKRLNLPGQDFQPTYLDDYAGLQVHASWSRRWFIFVRSVLERVPTAWTVARNKRYGPKRIPNINATLLSSWPIGGSRFRSWRLIINVVDRAIFGPS
jgi:hypothetical protein